MKRSIAMNNKAILLTQGAALAFLLAGAGAAAAQTAPSPVSIMEQPAQAGAPAESIDAPIPGAPAASTAAPAAPTAAAPAAVPVQEQAQTQTPTPTPTPTPAAAQVPADASATAGVPATAAPATPAATLPTASKTEAAAQPSPANLSATAPAAPSQEPTAPGAQAKTQLGGAPGAPNSGPRVTDILSTPATIRPLPNEYLVVKKVRNANDVDARLTAARSALAQGNYQAALEIFDNLYRKNPRDMRTIMGRAVALQRLGQNDEAMEAYQVALRTDPRNIEALTNVLGLLRGKDTPTALKKLHQLRDLYPANAEVTAQLGMVYGVSGDYASALKYLNMSDALKPGNPTVLYNRAVAYDRMGNAAQAAELYRKILLLASDGALDQSFPLDVVKQRLAVLR